ncbi:adenylate cyclase [Aureimonas endophytica]|uniref:Adenylate cyclase n=1 Tax=Aureimonas endophytica TaxID=2027858 RepID=A0A916ZL06_9HYPH|nr:adenylate/guanylate cyclase domain-containing protein [Aureimonas endophytica]GGE02960.1 adenylate cyclase [Aureimonas endophytica]
MSNRNPTFWIAMIAVSASFGVLYEMLLDEDGLSGVGIIYGTCIGGLAITYERGAFLAEYRAHLRRLPTLAYFATAEASLLAVVVCGMMLAGALAWALGLSNKELLEAVVPRPVPLLYSMAVSALLVFVLRIRDLIGAETFLNLLLGRYHRPVSEERAFLFLDLVGSTTYAEKHGDLAAQEFLKAVFAAIAEPVRRHRGQVDDYVGDQIIISWPLARAVEGARCVTCIFAVRETLRLDREWWMSRFGLVPELRAALHGGSVVTAEVGVDRHKIAYFGDVMNVTARLEGLCRETARPVLVSDAILDRILPLPEGILSEALGRYHLRGRNGTMLVHALAELRPPAIEAKGDSLLRPMGEFTKASREARIG